MRDFLIQHYHSLLGMSTASALAYSVPFVDDLHRILTSAASGLLVFVASKALSWVARKVMRKP